LGWSENITETAQLTVTDGTGASVTITPVIITFTSPAAPTVNITPTTLSISPPTAGTTVSGSATASGAGGLLPYTYSWVTTGGGGIAISNPAAAAPVFTSAALTYNQTLTQTYQVTLTDAAGNATTAPVGLTVTASGPPVPPATISINPTSYAYGSVRDLVTETASFTVSNTGAAGVFNASLVSLNGGSFVYGAGTCPINGGTLSGFSSCTLTGGFRGVAQCSGSVTHRLATLTVLAGSSTATVSLDGANWVYKPSDPQCL
jgi:hypothetical protein